MSKFLTTLFHSRLFNMFFGGFIVSALLVTTGVVLASGPTAYANPRWYGGNGTSVTVSLYVKPLQRSQPITFPFLGANTSMVKIESYNMVSGSKRNVLFNGTLDTPGTGFTVSGYTAGTNSDEVTLTPASKWGAFVDFTFKIADGAHVGDKFGLSKAPAAMQSVFLTERNYTHVYNKADGKTTWGFDVMVPLDHDATTFAMTTVGDATVTAQISWTNVGHHYTADVACSGSSGTLTCSAPVNSVFGDFGGYPLVHVMASGTSKDMGFIIPVFTTVPVVTPTP